MRWSGCTAGRGRGRSVDRKTIATKFILLQSWWNIRMDRLEHRHKMPRLAWAGRWLWVTPIKIVMWPVNKMIQRRLKEKQNDTSTRK